MVDAVAEWARAALAAEPSTLLVVGAYHIGKVGAVFGRRWGVRVMKPGLDSLHPFSHSKCKAYCNGNLAHARHQFVVRQVQGLHLMHPQERLFLGLARKLGLRVWCAPAKRRVLALLGLSPHELALLADDPREAQVLLRYCTALYCLDVVLLRCCTAAVRC